MNTEIKNTLFSMVTMRAPQPVEKKKEKISFIFRDDLVPKGIFDNAASGAVNRLKWAAMKDAISTAGFNGIENESAIGALHPSLYDFGIWIARNRSDYDAVELNKRLRAVTPLKYNVSSDLVLLAKLWDNLFFQVITEKDFYAKEAIIQMLVANHVASNAGQVDDAGMNDLLYAKVVLPSELFLETPLVTAFANKKAGDAIVNTYPSLSMQQLQAIALANLDIQSYQALLKELIKLEKTYKKAYDAEYKKQKDAYDASYKKIWDAYYTAVATAKQSWCAIRDPKIPYDANNPCDQPIKVLLPDVPAFVFEFRDELDIAFLQNNLTPENFSTVIRLIGLETAFETAKTTNKQLTGTIDDYSGFEDFINGISTHITLAQNTIYNNTVVTTPSFTSFGGVLIPNYQKTANNPFGFTLCAKNINNQFVNFDLVFDVPDSSWQVVNIACSYKFIPDGGTTSVSGESYISTTAVQPTNSQITMTNMYGTGISIKTFLKSTLFTAEITFANGCKKTFILTNFKTISCAQGTMTGDCSDGTAIAYKKDNDYNGSFLPSGFGMKQIGIADYKIVEQSVHCYVAGEVAHIENIMARERREKSTKKTTKSETIDTQKKEAERETNTDTATTTRFEMQSEVAQVLQDSRDFNASTQFHVEGAKWDLSANMGMATHNSKEQNTRQAVTNAKEVTQKAAERITSKVTSERVEKIINEYEETNIHEYDNRKGDKHVVGVYRWVDKIYKNQIVNFGKRMLFEFMIPEPGKLHTLGMEVDDNSSVLTGQIHEPIDPRLYDLSNTNSITSLNLKDFSKINDVTLRYWAGIYNVEYRVKQDTQITIGKGFNFKGDAKDYETQSGNGEIKIPVGYKTTDGTVNYSACEEDTYGDGKLFYVSVGKFSVQSTLRTQNKLKESKSISNIDLGTYYDAVPVSYLTQDYAEGTVNVAINCTLTDEASQQWQQACFKAIIDKYEKVKEAFDKKMAGTGDEITKTMETNPAFLRKMMNLILRKNCISYMIDQTPNAKRTYGKDMSNKKGAFTDYEVVVDANLDDYAAFAKFIEQAFEWSIMSYAFYPYYWANRDNWKKMYQFPATDDALFNSFMQAGMGRVIVTVRPGYEEAVRYYMQTGRIWDGGEVPVINDKLFLALIDELREPAGKPEGKAWATRLPTTMTILQANSIGLEVKQALPCNCDDITTFENPEMLPCNDKAFVMSNAQIGGGTGTAKVFGKIKGAGGIIATIMLKTETGIQQDSTLLDDNGEWEIKSLPAGSYSLDLDFHAIFEENNYSFDNDGKIEAITLTDSQVLEITAQVKKG